MLAINLTGMTQCARSIVGDQAIFRQVCAWPTITGTALKILTRSRLWAFDCIRSYKPLDLRKKNDVLHCSVPSQPPWLLKRPQIDFSVHASCKESTPPEIFRAKYYEICDQYQDYCKLYTDGSMSGDQVGSPPQKLFDFVTVLVFSERDLPLPALCQLNRHTRSL